MRCRPDRVRIKAVTCAAVLGVALALLSVAPASAAGQPYHVRLTWLHSPATTITVTWDTDQGLGSYTPTVRYGPSPGALNQSATGTSHSFGGADVDVRDVELTGLIPDTIYYYDCGDPSKGFSSVMSFRTAPVPGANQGFKFIAYGDSRQGFWLIEPSDNSDFQIWDQSCATIAQEQALFGVFGGDCVRSGNDEGHWDGWLDKYAQLSDQMVSMVSHGNHEDYEDNYFERFVFPGNERWYSFDVGKAHFTILDTGTGVDQALIDSQKAWLSADLAAAKAAGAYWLVVGFHRPPYATGSHGDQSDVKAGWVPIFDQYGVDLVLCGHNHYYERSYPMKDGLVTDNSSRTYYFRPQGTIYLTAGTVGAPKADFNPASWPAWQEKQYHYSVVDVLGDMSLRVTTKSSSNGATYEQFTIDKGVAPVLASVEPSSAMPGETVTLTGSSFGQARGTSHVSFGLAQATEYVSWSDTAIVAKVPQGATGPVEVKVTTDEGVSNALPFTGLDSSLDWYFAEGYTGAGFQEYLCVGNPTDTDASVQITYMFVDGTTQQQPVAVKAGSRVTVNVNEAVGPGREVSAHVSSDTPVVAERPVYFTYQGKWTGGDDTVGARAPNLSWYFAEGTTREGFDQWITVQNPGAFTADLNFRYMVEGEGEVVLAASVEPNSRATFSTREQIGAGKDASLFLQSNRLVVAERPIYFDYLGLAEHHWKGGHCVMGTPSRAKAWQFAEGTTRAGFEEWLCLQNPGDSDIKVAARYVLGPGQGGPVDREYAVPARQRLTVSVNEELGPEKDVSVSLSSATDFIAERPMYFRYHGSWDGGHDVLGTTAAGYDWFFAEGYTGAGFEEWLCLLNPGQADANVTITYYPETGQPIVKAHQMPASTRSTILVNEDAGAGQAISARVSSDQPLIVERPMYYSFAGLPGGHCVMGFIAR